MTPKPAPLVDVEAETYDLISAEVARNRMPWTWSLLDHMDIEPGTLATWIPLDRGAKWRPGIVVDVVRYGDGLPCIIRSRELFHERIVDFDCPPPATWNDPQLHAYQTTNKGIMASAGMLDEERFGLLLGWQCSPVECIVSAQNPDLYEVFRERDGRFRRAQARAESSIPDDRHRRRFIEWELIEGTRTFMTSQDGKIHPTDYRSDVFRAAGSIARARQWCDELETDDGRPPAERRSKGGIILPDGVEP